MPTTRPGHTSMRSGLVCSPRLMKLTASTTTTASISTWTNSPTEVVTAEGWSWICDSSMPIGSSFWIRPTRSLSTLPSWMMSPPLVIEMPSAITSCPWCRTFTAGGST